MRSNELCPGARLRAGGGIGKIGYLLVSIGELKEFVRQGSFE